MGINQEKQDEKQIIINALIRAAAQSQDPKERSVFQTAIAQLKLHQNTSCMTKTQLAQAYGTCLRTLTNHLIRQNVLGLLFPISRDAKKSWQAVRALYPNDLQIIFENLGYPTKPLFNN